MYKEIEEVWDRIPARKRLAYGFLITLVTAAGIYDFLKSDSSSNDIPQPTPTPKTETLNYRPDTLQGVVIRNINQSRILPSPVPSPDSF